MPGFAGKNSNSGYTVLMHANDPLSGLLHLVSL
jgi:hypothetical protein